MCGRFVVARSMGELLTIFEADEIVGEMPGISYNLFLITLRRLSRSQSWSTERSNETRTAFLLVTSGENFTQPDGVWFLGGPRVHPKVRRLSMDASRPSSKSRASRRLWCVAAV